MENIKGDASPRYFVERAYTPATADKGGTDYCYIGRATAAMEKADDTDEVSQDKVYRFHIYDSLEEAVYNAGVPIGTICKIKEVCQEDDGTPYYGITPIDREDVPFYYLEKELEKGQIVWVPAAPDKNEEQKGR